MQGTKGINRCVGKYFLPPGFNLPQNLVAVKKVKVVMVLEAFFLCPLTHFSEEPLLTIGLAQQQPLAEPWHGRGQERVLVTAGTRAGWEDSGRGRRTADSLRFYTVPCLTSGSCREGQRARECVSVTGWNLPDSRAGTRMRCLGCSLP